MAGHTVAVVRVEDVFQRDAEAISTGMHNGHHPRIVHFADVAEAHLAGIVRCQRLGSLHKTTGTGQGLLWLAASLPSIKL